MIIYPAIDIRKGKCVRLIQGQADKEVVYYDDPSEPSLLWKNAGSEWVHVVDLDGAFEGAPQNLNAIRKIAEAGMKVELGGGLRSLESVEQAIEAGVHRVIIGTRACTDTSFVEQLVQRWGDKVAVGIDAKEGKVALRGWVDTSETTALNLATAVCQAGVKTIIYTDISRDGMLTGPNFEAQEELLQHVDAQVIASGGVATEADVIQFNELSKRYDNLNGVIIGKALYDEKVELKSLLSAINT